MRVSARVGLAGGAAGVRVSRWLGALWSRGCLSCLFPLPFFFCQCGGMVDTPASKAGARLGVRVRVPRLVLGGSETVEYGACVRVLWPTLGRVA